MTTRNPAINITTDIPTALTSSQAQATLTYQRTHSQLQAARARNNQPEIQRLTELLTNAAVMLHISVERPTPTTSTYQSKPPHQ